MANEINASPWLEIEGRPVIEPGAMYEAAQRNGTPVDWYGKANSIELPRGYKAGTATLLMLRGDVKKLPKDKLLTIKWHDGKRTAKFHGWLLVRAHAITRSEPNDDEAVCVAEFKDVRALVDTASASVAWQQHATWKVVLERLEAAWRVGPYADKPFDGESGFWRAIDYGKMPDQFPQTLAFGGAPAWRAWNASLRMLSLDVVCDPFDQAFRVIDCGVDADETKRREPLTHDYGDIEGPIAKPSRLTVWQPRFGNDGAGHVSEGTFAYAFWWDYVWNGLTSYWFTLWATSWHLIDPTGFRRNTQATDLDKTDLPELKEGLGSADIVEATSAAWNNDPYAEQDNEATRERATEIGKRWLRRNARDIHRNQRHYSGVVKTLPDAHISMIRWRDYGDEAGTITELHYGEQPDPDRPYLIEAGVIGRGIWQLATTEQWPKIFVGADRPNRTSVVAAGGVLAPDAEIYFASTGLPVGHNSAGAGLPAVLHDPNESTRLVVQGSASYRVHLHGLLSLDPDEDVESVSAGQSLTVSVRVHRETSDGTIVSRTALSLSRLHFTVASSAYSTEPFTPRENVAGETVVTLLQNEWLSIANESYVGIWFDGSLVVTRQDVIE